MKTYQQVRDVIEHTRSVHRQLSRYYQALEQQVDKERVKLLLHYLSGHERNLEDALANYQGEVAQVVLDDYLQYLPAKNDEFSIADTSLQDTTIKNTPSKNTISEDITSEHTVIKRDMSVADVVSLALKYDDYLIDLYRDLSERGDQPQVRALFRNLLQLETQARHQMARGAVEAEDF